MPDDATTSTVPAEIATEVATETPATPTAYSQQDVDRMVADAVKRAHDSIYAEARRNAEGKVKSKKAAPTGENAGTDLASQVSLLTQAQGLASLSTENGLTASQRDAMIAAAKDAADPVAAGKEWLTMTNLLKSTTPPKPSTASGPPASNAGAPATTSLQGPGEDPLRWTESDIVDFMKRTGKMPVPHKPYDIRNREALKQVRRAAEVALANTRIQLGPRR